MSGADVLARRDTGEVAGGSPRWRSLAALGVLLVLIGVVAGVPPTAGAPFDPRSTGDSGLRGALDVLRTLGLEVELATADDGTASAVLVLPGVAEDVVDGLPAPGRRIVSTTPPPDVEAVAASGVQGLGVVARTVACPLLPDVAELRSVGWTGWVVTEPDPATTCVAVADGWWLVGSEPPGGGEHLHLQDLSPLVNARLSEGDTAVAVARLLAPGGAGGRVLVLEPGGGEAQGGLADLLDPRVVQAVWLLVGAVGLLAAARGRRLGAPPDERLPVRVPGGVLVRAVGDLRTRANHRGATLDALRRHTREQLRRAHRLPPAAGVDELLAAHAAAGLHVPTGARAALLDAPVRDDDALLAAASILTALRAIPASAARETAPTDPPPPPDPPVDDDRTTP